MQNVWIQRTIGILVILAACGVIAWAQKNSNTEKGTTLADLGVTEEQKTQIKAMWELKRQKQIQATKALQTLNQLAKDARVEDATIQKTLAEMRAKRKETQQQIEKAEEALTETLPPRAQLHLTLLGVLDNGLPRRIVRQQPDNKKEAETNQSPAK